MSTSGINSVGSQTATSNIDTSATTSALGGSNNLSDLSASFSSLQGFGKAQSKNPFQQLMQLMMNFMQMMLQMLTQLMQFGSAGNTTGQTTDQTGAGSTDGSGSAGNAGGTSGTGGTTDPDPTVIDGPEVPGPGDHNGLPIDDGSDGTSCAGNCKPPLEAVTDDTGKINVLTEDGYTVSALGMDMSWTVTGPDGKKTTIWGDPHVNESDGDKWDFQKNSTFHFGNNKVTVEVVPYGNGAYVTSRVTIYNGNQRITIGGIDKNQIRLETVANDAREHDAGIDDGDAFDRTVGEAGEGWTLDGAQTEMAHTPETPAATATNP